MTKIRSPRDLAFGQRFKIDFGNGIKASCSQVTMTDDNFSTVIRKPGLRGPSKLTLKRILAWPPEKFMQLIETSNINPVNMPAVKITTYNENNEPVQEVELKNAKVWKGEGAGLKASGNEIAMEELTLVCEGLKFDFVD